MASSFWSMKPKKLVMTWEKLLPFSPEEVGAGSSFFLFKRMNWKITFRKNNRNEAMAATPQTKYNPQKLVKRSWLGSELLPLREMQLVLQNHFLWIFWRIPSSESFNIAVDISTARGESLGKACCNLKNLKNQMNLCLYRWGNDQTQVLLRDVLLENHWICFYKHDLS